MLSGVHHAVHAKPTACRWAISSGGGPRRAAEHPVRICRGTAFRAEKPLDHVVKQSWHQFVPSGTGTTTGVQNDPKRMKLRGASRRQPYVSMVSRRTSWCTGPGSTHTRPGEWGCRAGHGLQAQVLTRDVSGTRCSAARSAKQNRVSARRP